LKTAINQLHTVTAGNGKPNVSKSTHIAIHPVSVPVAFKVQESKVLEYMLKVAKTF
jgi:hypothetical protein